MHFLTRQACEKPVLKQAGKLYTATPSHPQNELIYCSVVKLSSPSTRGRLKPCTLQQETAVCLQTRAGINNKLLLEQAEKLLGLSFLEKTEVPKMWDGTTKPGEYWLQFKLIGRDIPMHFSHWVRTQAWCLQCFVFHRVFTYWKLNASHSDYSLAKPTRNQGCNKAPHKYHHKDHMQTYITLLPALKEERLKAPRLSEKCTYWFFRSFQIKEDKDKIRTTPAWKLKSLAGVRSVSENAQNAGGGKAVFAHVPGWSSG